MFKLFADKVVLRALEVETLTSGSRKIYTCQFAFSTEWDGLTKTVVFQAGDIERAIILGDDSACDIPHEVLENSGKNLFAGVRGTRDAQIVMPTTWTSIGWIQRGTNAAEFSSPPTPGVYDQLLANYGEALERGLPPGGAKGQVPVKKSGEDFDVEWQNPSGGAGTLPGGGSPGQVLTKTEDGEDWQDLPVATENAVGGVKPVTATENMSQDVGVASDGRLVTGRGAIYIYPVAIDSDTSGMASHSSEEIIALGLGGASIWFMFNNVLALPAITLDEDGVAFAATLPDGGGGFVTRIVIIDRDKHYTATNINTQIPATYILPQATAEQLGGIKADSAEDGDTQPVRIGADGKPVVDCYSKSYIDTALGNYITDIAELVGGDA